MKTQPSKFWTSLFKRFCHDDFLEELQGDLEEKFYQQAEKHGLKKANKVYRNEILKMIRPSVWKTPKLITNLSRMSLFQIHLKLAVRNLARNKVFSAVNIFGLSAALCLCLFFVNMLYTGYSMDSQHPESDRLYRIVTETRGQSGNPNKYASSPYALKTKLQNEIPQIELASTLYKTSWLEFPQKEETLMAHGTYIDDNFFKLFDFEVIAGDVNAIFTDINSVVITDELARKVFGDEPAVGKTTTIGFVIKAVIESPRGKSHMDFEFLSSMQGYESRLSRSSNLESKLQSWTDIYYSYHYVRLAEQSSISELDESLERISAQVHALRPEAKRQLAFKVQPVSDINFGEQLIGEQSFVYPKDIMIVLVILISLVISLASFNYTNLSIARALQRTKEIGIRKVVGSSRQQIVSQFLTETTIFSLLALIIALLGYLYFLPIFPLVLSELEGLITLELNSGILISFLFFSLFVGLVAGILPALHFSTIRPLAAFNARIKHKSMSLINLRKILTGFQLTISMFCVLFISIGFDQYQQLLSSDLGFKSDALVTFSLGKTDPELLKAELDKIPEIRDYTFTSFLPGTGSTQIGRLTNESKQDTTVVYIGIADSSFYKVYEPRLLKGGYFNRFGAKEGIPQIMVSPEFLKRLNIPLDSAIGTQVQHIQRDSKVEIVGVLDEFVRNAIENSRVPLVIENHEKGSALKNVTVAFNEEGLFSGLDKIESAWKGLNEETSFDPGFLDDQIEKSYQELLGIIKSVTFLGLMIVIISVLGQLGMALYNAQTRIKEIGIRKVLGAGVSAIIRRLLKGTLLSLGISTLIALPLAYLFFQNTIMAILAVETDISVTSLFRAVVGFMVLISFIIITQTWRIAQLNPSESLRNE